MKMNRTLYLKLLVGYILFAALSLIAVYAFTSPMIMNYLLENTASSLYKEASLISTTYAGRIYDNDEETKKAAKATLKAIDAYISSPVWIMTASGRIIFDSRDIHGEADRIYEDFNAAESGKYYMTGNFYGAFEDEYLSVFSPIISNFRVAGYVIIHTPLSNVRLLHDELMNIVVISLGIIIIFSLVILLTFTFVVYLPLDHITKAAEEYASGNMAYRIPENYTQRRDEMGYLAGTLSYMASEIARSEENQRKFIANVSHDFRSPLTSIRGYLEAMMDGTIPPEMSEKYLSIVHNETQRLTKLTNGLLELNSLSSRGLVLQPSSFDINAAIKRTAETFGGTCKNKKISIELILSGQTLYVTADEAKIEQVLYNLLDNAIKFSHTNSIIKLETTEKGEKIFVSVKDFGTGIPSESQKRVFDRFYKIDSSRGRDKGGTGLGLSIVKEIITAHGENINVISTEGVGSEFIFTLPKSR